MAPKRGRVNEKNNVVQGYLHAVTPVRSFDVTRKCFNCILQTSRDEYRGCVVFGTKKHARFVQAADKHTPLKLSKVRNPSNVGDGLDICINQATTVRVVKSIGFDYKEHNDFRTLNLEEVAGLQDRQYVGKIQAKVVWLQAASKMVSVRGNMLELKECHVADRTGKIRLSLWGGCIGQVEQGVSYVLTDLSVRKEGEMILTTTKTTTIRVSEEVPFPESVAKLRLEDLDAKEYPMSGPKKSYCLIVNNFDFSGSSPELSNRTGTHMDAERLRCVFTWLGFQVEVVQDATSKQMLSSVQQLASRDHSGMDCVACVVLSHGLKGGVYGVDGKVVWLEELTDLLNGLQCPSLIEKPKLFFIQACQGNKNEKGVPVPANRPARPEVSDQTDRPSGPGVPAQTDGPSSPGVHAQTDGPCSPGDIYSDAVVASGSIPSMADLLIVMSTPPSYVSLRSKEKGTWFIQSLCKNLERFVPRHKDLVSILKEVIRDVTNETTSNKRRQIPIYTTTNMLKLVVFPAPEGPCPSLPTSL